jgi:hypothetical protein
LRLLGLRRWTSRTPDIRRQMSVQHASLELD